MLSCAHAAWEGRLGGASRYAAIEGTGTAHTARRSGAELRDVLQSHRTDMQAVFDMVATLTSTLSLDKLLAYVVKLCAELTGCVGALVYLWDEEGERLVVRAGVEGYEQWIGRFSLAMGEGLTGWTALTRQPGIIRDNPTADPRFKSVPELNDDRLQSYLTIPIVSPADRLLGVITLHTGAPHEFGEDDLTLMNTLSRLIAVAVENAQLYERRDRQMQVLHSLAETSHAVVQTSSLRHMLYRLASTAGTLLGADHCAVLTLDEGGSHLGLETLWSDGPEVAASPPAAVPADGHWARALGATAPVVLVRKEHREAFAAFDSLVPHARTVLVAPMRVSDRAVGVFLCFAEHNRSFGEEDRELFDGGIAGRPRRAERPVDRGPHRTQRRPRPVRGADAGDEGELGLEARARRLGVDLSGPSVVATFEIAAHPTDLDGDRLWMGLRQDLTGSFPGRLHVPRPHADRARPPVRGHESGGARRTAGRRGRPPRAAAGHRDLGGPVPGVPPRGRLPRRVRAGAPGALMGRAIRGPGVVVPFDELGAQWHLFSVAQQQVRDVYQERLETLLAHDRAHGSQLFRTVEVYLESMGNAKLAAQKLFIHRNTLRQRFDKINKVTGINLADTERWFDLMMALRIIRLRELSDRSLGAPPATPRARSDPAPNR
jgi:GAF domain-containing protein